MIAWNLGYALLYHLQKLRKKIQLNRISICIIRFPHSLVLFLPVYQTANDRASPCCSRATNLECDSSSTEVVLLVAPKFDPPVLFTTAS